MGQDPICGLAIDFATTNSEIAWVLVAPSGHRQINARGVTGASGDTEYKYQTAMWYHPKHREFRLVAPPVYNPEYAEYRRKDLSREGWFKLTGFKALLPMTADEARKYIRENQHLAGVYTDVREDDGMTELELVGGPWYAVEALVSLFFSALVRMVIDAACPDDMGTSDFVFDWVALSYPVDSTHEFRNALADLAKSIVPLRNMDNIHIAPEPLPSLVWLEFSGHFNLRARSTYIEVMDGGGGTFDFVAAKRVKEDGGRKICMKILDYHGCNTLGGAQVDKILVNFIKDKVSECPVENVLGLSLATEGYMTPYEQERRMLEKAEGVKIATFDAARANALQPEEEDSLTRTYWLHKNSAVEAGKLPAAARKFFEDQHALQREPYSEGNAGKKRLGVRLFPCRLRLVETGTSMTLKGYVSLVEAVHEAFKQAVMHKFAFNEFHTAVSTGGASLYLLTDKLLSQQGVTPKDMKMQLGLDNAVAEGLLIYGLLMTGAKPFGSVEYELRDVATATLAIAYQHPLDPPKAPYRVQTIITRGDSIPKTYLSTGDELTHKHSSLYLFETRAELPPSASEVLDTRRQSQIVRVDDPRLHHVAVKDIPNRRIKFMDLKIVLTHDYLRPVISYQGTDIQDQLLLAGALSDHQIERIRGIVASHPVTLPGMQPALTRPPGDALQGPNEKSRGEGGSAAAAGGAAAGAPISSSSSQSNYIVVSRSANSGMWHWVCRAGRDLQEGYCDSEEAAARAYDRALKAKVDAGKTRCKNPSYNFPEQQQVN